MEKTAFITGASRGIGLACTRLFAQQGYTVYAGYFKTPEPLLSLARQPETAGKIIPVCGDVSQSGDVTRMFDGLPPVDTLICNAAIAQFMPFTDMTERHWEDMINVNLKSVFLCAKAAVPAMIRCKNGNIINISSVWGVTGGSCESHYSAAKAGLIGLTKALAKELGPSGIRVNCIAPGVIETDMVADLTPDDRQSIVAQTPLERIGSPDEIARAALFLARDGGFITGHVLNVNGGYYI